ncbi:transcription factor 7-like 1-B isoform X2 [Notolabrus celidotus]|uniref:transcription factor 7-like 1-B isoform X2 n=1 Tax=Notolabrus celidotus TaxID=1203425 RepID=UPI00148FAC62|nr:transcription factor 7-like 1-B isoform X2 [Notolabrus celidotus]
MHRLTMLWERWIGKSFNFHPQLSECQSKRYGQCFHSLHPCEGANTLMAVPGLNWSRQANPIVYRNPNFMQSCPCHSPPDEQHLPYIQSAGNYDPKEQAGCYPSPLSHPYISVPVWSPPRVMNQKLPSARYRRRGEKQDDGKPYIKKPLNAFMLFLKEMRTKIVAEHDFKNCSAFNTSMGKMWQALSESEKDKYYKQSDIERHLHSQQHPSWTCNKNYGERRSNKTRSDLRRFASKPQEVPAQANKLCVTPVQTAVMEACTSHTVAVMAPHTQTFLSEQPHTRTAVTLPV